MSVTLKTSLGDLKVELHCHKVPTPCKNFLALCAAGQYNGTTFHRNIKNFIVQGGDTDKTNGKGGRAIITAPAADQQSPDQLALGDSSGGAASSSSAIPAGGAASSSALVPADTAPANPAEKFYLEHDIKSDLRHDRRGVVAFADTGKIKKIGSQFYITYKRLPNLDGQYTVIGRLIDGFGTLQKMEEAPVVDAKKARPVTDIVIEDVLIHANPIADEEL